MEVMSYTVATTSVVLSAVRICPQSRLVRRAITFGTRSRRSMSVSAAAREIVSTENAPGAVGPYSQVSLEGQRAGSGFTQLCAFGKSLAVWMAAVDPYGEYGGKGRLIECLARACMGRLAAKSGLRACSGNGCQASNTLTACMLSTPVTDAHLSPCRL